MLNNLTNFFNLIRGRRIKKELEPGDLIAVGTQTTKRVGEYKPTAIQFSDLQAQLGGGEAQIITLNSYQELYTAVVSETLIPGAWYKVPYKSVNFLNGWNIANNNPTPTDPNFNPREIYEGETEILLVQAISTSDIAEISYSEKYPGDIIQYAAYTNKIGVDIGGISNGSTLPNSSTVSGFNLQWDGTNVYFNMPTGYPALFGHYFYLYAEFDGGNYFQDGCFEPLTPGDCIPQYPYTADDPDYGYPKAISRIRVENNGTKVILLDLTQTDYNNYDIDTLYVDTVYALGDAYGWITKRIDTERNITTPLDFRGRRYRRFRVDLTAINPSIGSNYFIGIGDDYLGQGTTGEYKDYKVLQNDGYDVFNIEWDDLGGPSMAWYAGYNDNVVIAKFCFNNKFGHQFFDNTIVDDCIENKTYNQFRNNVLISVRNTTFDGTYVSNTSGIFFENNFFTGVTANNNIGSVFRHNVTTNTFINNTMGNDVEKNVFNGTFVGNIITSSQFRLNIINSNISSTNFTTATHVYGPYDCQINRASNNNDYLSYFNGTNVQYTSVTA